MISMRVRVIGSVQGVGFRWFTREAAVAHGVAGWVRNRPDGSVEAELHGAPADVDAVISALQEGPPGSEVLSLTSTDEQPPASAPTGFEIRATA